MSIKNNNDFSHANSTLLSNNSEAHKLTKSALLSIQNLISIRKEAMQSYKDGGEINVLSLKKAKIEARRALIRMENCFIQMNEKAFHHLETTPYSQKVFLSQKQQRQSY